MNALCKTGRALYKVYVAIGIAAMGFVAFGVISSVLLRYFFGISFAFLEELITLIFAFTTFWSIGICVLEDEHVVIDFFYQMIPEKTRRWVNLFNYTVVIVTLALLQYYAFNWISVAGKTISNGLRVPYVYLYGAMPLGVGVSLACVVAKIISICLNKPFDLKPAEVKPEEDDITW